MPLNQVPQPGQTLLVTRNPINQNWTTINAGFLQNHIELGIAGAGKHKFLQMPEQGAAPVTAANEAGLYAAVGVTSNESELVFRRENNGPSIAFTEFQAISPAQGWTRLPSGILLKWDVKAVNDNRDTDIVTLYNFGPPFTAVYQVFLTCGPATSGGDQTNISTIVQAGPFAVNSFTFRVTKINGVVNPVQGSVKFLAIGKG